MFFQLINKRYEKHSTIITKNKPFGKWHEIFNDVTLANAILDRLLHHSHIININGNSYRSKNKLKISSESTEPIQNWVHFYFQLFVIFILTLTLRVTSIIVYSIIKFSFKIIKIIEFCIYIINLWIIFWIHFIIFFFWLIFPSVKCIFTFR